MRLFGHAFDHDYYFELPSDGERDTQSITRCSTSHHRDFRALPRANRTFSAVRNSIPCATSSTCEPPVSAPWRPWRSSASPQRQVEVLVAPFLIVGTVTCAASTSKKRNSELPCFVMCPNRRRFPLDSSNGTSPDSSRSACHTETAPLSR